MTMSIGGTVVQGFGYTADGSVNLLNPSSVAPSGYSITDLTYNQDARPSTLNSNGQPAIGFAYDGFGQRFSAENIPNSYDIIYQYGQGGLLREEANTSGTQTDYIYLNGRPIAVLNPGTATLSFLHDDRLGTPQIATDSGQNIAWQTTYDPFGNTSSTGGTITQDLRLPGQVFDEIGGEYLNGFRDYLPLIGRYIEPDPLKMQGSYRLYLSGLIYPTVAGFDASISGNAYQYANDNPTYFTDPFGLAPPQYPNGYEIYTGILSNGGWIYYGNWGGPGWTGGQETPYEDLSPSDQANLAPPIDAQDACYEQHDKCYSRARVSNNGTSSTIAHQCSQQKQSQHDAQRGCDAELMGCLRDVNSSAESGHNAFSTVAQPFFSVREMWP